MSRIADQINKRHEEHIRERLAEFYDDVEIEMWLGLPHPMLDGDSPAYLISIGEGYKVDHIINQLDSGAFT